jgi:hypothetical protein
VKLPLAVTWTTPAVAPRFGSRARYLPTSKRVMVFNTPIPLEFAWYLGSGVYEAAMGWFASRKAQ